MHKSGMQDIGVKLAQFHQLMEKLNANFNHKPDGSALTFDETFNLIDGVAQMLGQYQQLCRVIATINEEKRFPAIQPDDMLVVINKYELLIRDFLNTKPDETQWRSITDLVQGLNNAFTLTHAKIKELQSAAAKAPVKGAAKPAPTAADEELERLRRENAALKIALFEAQQAKAAAKPSSTTPSSTSTASSTLFSSTSSTTKTKDLQTLISTVEKAKTEYEKISGGWLHPHSDAGKEKVITLLALLKACTDLQGAKQAFIDYFCDNSWFQATRYNNHSFCSFWFNQLRTNKDLVTAMNKAWFANSSEKLIIPNTVNFTEGDGYDARKKAFECMQRLGSTTSPAHSSGR